MPETTGSWVPWCKPVNGLATPLGWPARTEVEVGPRLAENGPNRPKNSTIELIGVFSKPSITRKTLVVGTYAIVGELNNGVFRPYVSQIKKDDDAHGSCGYRGVIFRWMRNGSRAGLVMKFVSVLLILCGVICLFLGAIWDTAPTGYVNLYAVSQQQMLLLLGGFTFLGGILLFGFLRLRDPKQPSKTTKEFIGERENRDVPISAKPLEVFNDVWLFKPEFNVSLRLFVAFGLSLPMAYLAYNHATYFFWDAPKSMLFILVAVVFVLLPGALVARLRQLLLFGAIAFGILLFHQLSLLAYMFNEGHNIYNRGAPYSTAEYLGVSAIITICACLAAVCLYLRAKYVASWATLKSPHTTSEDDGGDASA